jgi:hypothetical protein
VINSNLNFGGLENYKDPEEDQKLLGA